MSQPCPCGSADEYSLCCGRIVSGERVAPDPSHLMRSRYCAFVMKDADYLIKSWHPTCNAAAFRDDIIAGFANTRWLGLTIFEHTWSEAENTGYVSFIARFPNKGKPGRLSNVLVLSKKTVSGIILTVPARSWVEMIPARAVQAKNLKSAAASDA